MPTLRIVTWNVCAGLTRERDRRDLDLVLATLRWLDADLVALQEVDRDQPRSGGLDQAAWLAAKLGMWSHFAPALLGPVGRPGPQGGPRGPWGPGGAGTVEVLGGSQGGSELPPWTIGTRGAGGHDPGGPAYGVALLGRVPVGEVEVLPLPCWPGDEPRAALLASMALGRRPLAVGATHLTLRRRAAAAQLRLVQRRLAGRPAPRVLLGDLNLERALVRAVSGPGWRLLLRHATYPNRPDGGAARTQIDHVLASGPLTATRTRVVAGRASDHRAGLVEVSWE